MALRERVQSEIDGHPVMVFGKSYCGFTRRAKETLANLNVHFHLIDLDLIPEGEQMQATLLELTGQRTVPNIFIGGTHVGGASELQNKLNSGEVQELLRRVNINV